MFEKKYFRFTTFHWPEGFLFICHESTFTQASLLELSFLFSWFLNFLFPNLIILLLIRRAVANLVTVFNGLLVWRSLTSAITSEAETVAQFSHAFESTKISYKMLDFVSRMKRYTLKPHHLWYYTVDHLVAAQLQI